MVQQGPKMLSEKEEEREKETVNINSSFHLHLFHPEPGRTLPPALPGGSRGVPRPAEQHSLSSVSWVFFRGLLPIVKYVSTVDKKT